jgi:hypothetical protein
MCIFQNLFLFRCYRFWCSACFVGFLCPYTQHMEASDRDRVRRICDSFDVVRQISYILFSFPSRVEPLGLHYRIEGTKVNVVLYRTAIPINFLQSKLRTLWDPVILHVWTTLLLARSDMLTHLRNSLETFIYLSMALQPLWTLAAISVS